MDDAAHKLKNFGFFVVVALLLSAPAFAWQAPAFTLSSSTVSCQGTTCGAVSIGASNVNSITFSISAVNYSQDTGSNFNWLQNPAAQGVTTPYVLQFSLNSVAGLAPGLHTATVTLHATDKSGAADATITISFQTGSGGGGGNLSSSPSTLTLPAAATGQTVSGTLTISTTSTLTVSLNNITTTTNSGGQWLTASNQGSSSITNGFTTNILVLGNATNLGTGTYTGTVKIIPSLGAELDVPVTLNVNTSGGSTITTNLGGNPVTWSYTTNSGNYPAPVAVSVASSTVTFYNATANSSNGWLLVNTSGGTGGGTSQNGIAISTILTIAPSTNMNSLTTGVYTGYIYLADTNNPSVTLNTITVNLSINGGTTTGLSVTPNPLTFPNVSVGGAQVQSTLTVTSSLGGSLSISASSSPTTWLSFSTSSNSVAAGGTATITAFANPAGLSANTYFGSLNITVGGQSLTVSVSLPVGSSTGGGSTAIAPTTLAFSYQQGTNPAFVAQQLVAITGPSGAWSSSVSSNAPWITNFPTSGTSLPDQTKVVLQPGGLTAGNYSGTITITTPGGSQTVTVNLAVTQGPVLLPTPGSLIFTYNTGAALPQPQAVYFSNSDGSALSIADANVNATWLQASTPTNSMGVSVNPTGMAAGLYTATISLDESGAANTPLIIPVVLLVNGGGGTQGPLTLTPSSFSFTSNNGVLQPSSPQTLQVTASVANTFTVTTPSSASWLGVSPLSGTSPVNLSVTVNASGLNTGTYSANITFNSNGNVQNVPVSLIVNGGSTNPGNVTVTCQTSCGTPAPAMSFSAQVGSGVLSPGALSIASATGTAPVSFTVSTNTSSGGSWLSTNAGSGTLTTPFQLSVSINTTTLTQAATYNGNIVITPTGGTTVTVPVQLILTAPPTVSASPTSLSFTYRLGDPAPSTQAINVTANAGATLSFSATASPAGSWLTATPASGSTPGTVNVGINPGSLTSAGTYTGTVVVAGTNGAQGSTTVNITVTVTAPLPTVAKAVNAASYIDGPIAPGEIITLFASDASHAIGPSTPVGLTLDSTGKVSTTLGGVQVLINGVAAPLIYVSSLQISAVVPYEIAGFLNANVLVRMISGSTTISSNAINKNVTTTSPGIFTQNSSGTGPGAILNQNNTVNSPSNPASRGDTIVIYMTGEGQTTPPGVTGKVTVAAPTPPYTPTPLLLPAITIGGQPANYTFVGEAPGFVSGVLQLNVVIPASVATGDQQVIVTMGGNSSQSGVTVSVH
jgi:uncharacterized protein (TIGR03437 family)